MEIGAHELERMKDLWSDYKDREQAKRIISIALGELGKGVTLDLALSLSQKLDELLLPTEEARRERERNHTL